MGEARPARRWKAYLALTLGLGLAACATTPGDLPDVRYAEAASHGKVTTLLAGRPSMDQVAIAEERWSKAVGEAYACGLKKREVFEVGLVGAMELATMTSLARGGGKAEQAQALIGYTARVAALAFSGDSARPSPRRCEALRTWLPRVRADGKEALKRAHEAGYLDRL